MEGCRRRKAETPATVVRPVSSRGDRAVVGTVASPYFLHTVVHEGDEVELGPPSGVVALPPAVQRRGPDGLVVSSRGGICGTLLYSVADK